MRVVVVRVVVVRVVVVRVVVVLVIVMVVVGAGTERDRVELVGDAEDADAVGFGCFERGDQSFLEEQSVRDDQLRVTHGCRVRGRRLVAVRVDAGPHEHTDGPVVTEQVRDQVTEDRRGRDDLDRGDHGGFGLRGGRFRRLGGIVGATACGEDECESTREGRQAEAPSVGAGPVAGGGLRGRGHACSWRWCRQSVDGAGQERLWERFLMSSREGGRWASEVEGPGGCARATGVASAGRPCPRRQPARPDASPPSPSTMMTAFWRISST